MKNGQVRVKAKHSIPDWEKELLAAEAAGAKGVRVVPSLVTYETDLVYGTKTKFVKGVPISFVKLPDTKPVKQKKQRDEEEDDLL